MGFQSIYPRKSPFKPEILHNTHLQQCDSRAALRLQNHFSRIIVNLKTNIHKQNQSPDEDVGQLTLAFANTLHLTATTEPRLTEEPSFSTAQM
jgi:hypothetical protein